MKVMLTLAIVFAFVQPPVSALAPTPNYAAGFAAVSQDPAPPSPSPTPDTELDQAKRDTELAKQKKEKAEAEKAELEARIAMLKAQTGDASKLSVPTGGVKTDAEGFVEVKILSIEAARRISEDLGSDLCRWNIGTLVIYDKRDIDAVDLYRALLVQFDKFANDFEKKHGEAAELLKTTDPKTQSHVLEISVKTEDEKLSAAALPALLAPQVAGDIVASVAQLVNLFRTETEFQNKNVAISDDEVVSHLVGFFRTASVCEHRPAVYYPTLYPLPVVGDQSQLLLVGKLMKIDELKNIAIDDVKKLDTRIKLISDIAAAIDERDAKKDGKDKKELERKAILKTDPSCKSKACKKVTGEIGVLEGDIEHADGAISDATSNGEKGFSEKYKQWLVLLKRLRAETQLLIDSAGQVITKLQTPDDTTKLTPLVQLLRAARLEALLKKDSTFVLRVAVTANGTTKIKKNLFVDAKVRHSAGATLVYQLFNHDGVMVAGSGRQFYFPYQSAKDVRQRVEEGSVQTAQSTVKSPAQPGNNSTGGDKSTTDLRSKRQR